MSETKKVYPSDSRGVDSVVLLRDRVALDIFPTVLRATAEGRLKLPTKADGTAIGFDFGVALRARSLASALVNALTPQAAASDAPAATGEEGGPF